MFAITLQKSRNEQGVVVEHVMYVEAVPRVGEYVELPDSSGGYVQEVSHIITAHHKVSKVVVRIK